MNWSKKKKDEEETTSEEKWRMATILMVSGLSSLLTTTVLPVVESNLDDRSLENVFFFFMCSFFGQLVYEFIHPETRQSVWILWIALFLRLALLYTFLILAISTRYPIWILILNSINGVTSGIVTSKWRLNDNNQNQGLYSLSHSCGKVVGSSISWLIYLYMV